MKRVTKVVEHLRVEEIDARIKQCTEPWRHRRWHVIRCALVHPKPAAEIALEVGLARQTVHNLVSAYNRQGPQMLETPGHGQWQRAYLSFAQEQALGDKFRKKSAAGQVSTATQFKPAVERVIGRQVHKTTVYRLLKRHQWRKVEPRPRHPQASVAEQMAFKKTSRSKSGRSCKPAIPRTHGRYWSWRKMKVALGASTARDAAGLLSLSGPRCLGKSCGSVSMSLPLSVRIWVA